MHTALPTPCPPSCRGRTPDGMPCGCPASGEDLDVRAELDRIHRRESESQRRMARQLEAHRAYPTAATAFDLGWIRGEPLTRGHIEDGVAVTTHRMERGCWRRIGGDL